MSLDPEDARLMCETALLCIVDGRILNAPRIVDNGVALIRRLRDRGALAPSWNAMVGEVLQMALRDEDIRLGLELAASVWPDAHWDGKPSASPIRLVNTQGFGDCIQCFPWVRYAAKIAGRVILHVDRKLERLLLGVDPAVHVTALKPGRHAKVDSMYLLPHLVKDITLRVDRDVVGKGQPFLTGDYRPRLGAQHIIQELRRLKRPVIACCWRVEKLPTERSIPFENFKSLFGLEASFVSIQRGDVPEALPQNVIQLDPEAQGSDFAATAGILRMCDAYVGPDCSTSHLAAAMGIKTIVMRPLNRLVQWGWSDGPWPYYASSLAVMGPPKWEWPTAVRLAKDCLRALVS